MPLVTSEKEKVEVSTEASVLEGSVLVNILKPGAANTFQEYSETVFNPAALLDIKQQVRIDVIFDSYKEKSLKLTTRKNGVKAFKEKLSPNQSPHRNEYLFSRLMRTRLRYSDLFQAI